MSLYKPLLIGFLFCGSLALIQAGILTSCDAQAKEPKFTQAEVDAFCAKRADKCSIAITAKWHEAFEKDSIGYTKGAIWFFGERHDYR